MAEPAGIIDMASAAPANTIRFTSFLPLACCDSTSRPGPYEHRHSDGSAQLPDRLLLPRRFVSSGAVVKKRLLWPKFGHVFAPRRSDVRQMHVAASVKATKWWQRGTARSATVPAGNHRLPSQEQENDIQETVSMSDLAPVLARAEANLDSSLATLFDLVRVPSISTDPAHAADCRRAAQLLADYLTSLGFDASVRDPPAHPMVVAPHEGPSPDSPHFLFYG